MLRGAVQCFPVDIEQGEWLAAQTPADRRRQHCAAGGDSNGVINLCADKRAVFHEIHRVLRPGGVLQFADIANGWPVPPEVLRHVDFVDLLDRRRATA